MVDERPARKPALDPTGDPRKIVNAVEVVTNRTFGQGRKELEDYFRACLRIARRQGRIEARGK